MSNSRVFDRAAGFYDQTRLLPDEVATTGLDALVNVIGPKAHLLEAGVGTGRIAVPLWQRGINLTGVDLSWAMMARLRAKHPAARLAQADIQQLPFGPATFDAVLTVHVLHLVAAWRDVLREFRRVLRPGGVIVNAYRQATNDSPRSRLGYYWQDWLRENHPSAAPAFIGVRDEEAIAAALRDLGAAVSLIEAITYRETYRLDEMLDSYAGRIYSATWELPDDVLHASVAAARAWASSEYGPLDRPVTDDMTFFLQAGRFPNH